MAIDTPKEQEFKINIIDIYMEYMQQKRNQKWTTYSRGGTINRPDKLPIK